MVSFPYGTRMTTKILNFNFVYQLVLIINHNMSRLEQPRSELALGLVE